MITITELAFRLDISTRELNNIGIELNCKKITDNRGKEFYPKKHAEKIIKHFIKAAQLNVGAVFLLDAVSRGGRFYENKTPF